MTDLGNKIMIIGSAGSGKSTLARQLGIRTGLPVIHLDKEFWQSGWIMTPREEWIEKQNRLLTGDEWIVDGNYGGTMDVRLERADSVIFLDFNRMICLYGILKRWLLHIGKTRPDMPEGCPEKIDMEFIKWVWDFPKRSRPHIVERLEQHKEEAVIIMKNRKEVRRFLEQAGK